MLGSQQFELMLQRGVVVVDPALQAGVLAKADDGDGDRAFDCTLGVRIDEAGEDSPPGGLLDPGRIVGRVALRSRADRDVGDRRDQLERHGQRPGPARRAPRPGACAAMTAPASATVMSSVRTSMTEALEERRLSGQRVRDEDTEPHRVGLLDVCSGHRGLAPHSSRRLERTAPARNACGRPSAGHDSCDPANTPAATSGLRHRSSKYHRSRTMSFASRGQRLRENGRDG